jgi:hypothetical protein
MKTKWDSSGTHQLLDYADDMNLLRHNIDTIQKVIQTLTNTGKEVGIELNADKTKCMLLFENSRQNQIT